MKLSLSISPCPNDTFMFDAMINGRVDTEGLEFDVRFADIEELNRGLSGNNPPEISKASYAVYPLIKNRYAILDSGSALGQSNGPLLVTADEEADITDYSMRIAIPGIHTTANLLMERLYPHLIQKYPFLFSDIMDKVGAGVCDAGVLIHEGRFVYHKKGLFLLSDLGLEWEKATGLPLPLGAILASRQLPGEVGEKVDRVLRRSIEYALTHPGESTEFVRSHAQEMDPEVIEKHISLFVNGYSLSLGEKGRESVYRLLNLEKTESLFRA